MHYKSFFYNMVGRGYWVFNGFYYLYLLYRICYACKSYYFSICKILIPHSCTNLNNADIKDSNFNFIIKGQSSIIKNNVKFVKHFIIWALGCLLRTKGQCPNGQHLLFLENSNYSENNHINNHHHNSRLWSPSFYYHY